MAKKPEPAETVVPLFRRGLILEGLPEIPMARPATATRPVDNIATKVTDIDLTGKPKVWMLNGRGNSGKTLFCRYLVHAMTERGRTAVLTAIDPGNRSLSTWFDNVMLPPEGEVQTARWLSDFLDWLMTSKQEQAIIDTGGGDRALGRVLDEVPTLSTDLEGAGLGFVAVHILSPSIDDLDSLNKLETAGLRPRATLLLLNAGLGDPSRDREEKFALVVRHSIFQAAVARGAVVAWMPGLEEDVVQEIDAKRVDFTMARDGQVPEGATFPPIGGLRRSRVNRWLYRMGESLEPIATWLP
jgi:hypothetical protein